MTPHLHPIHRLQKILKRKKIKTFLVTSIVNLRYLTGVECSAGCMIIAPQSAELFLDARYFSAASKHSIPGVRVTSLTMLRDRMKKLRRIHIEGDQVTLTMLSRWQARYKNTKFIQTSGLIEELRRSKSPSEIASIKHACAITLSILKKMPQLLKIGITERAVSRSIEELAQKLGAEAMAFETIVGFGAVSYTHLTLPTKRIV